MKAPMIMSPYWILVFVHHVFVLRTANLKVWCTHRRQITIPFVREMYSLTSNRHLRQCLHIRPRARWDVAKDEEALVVVAR